mmetsp:Transcript_35163/g.85169  ORF Transcript_35163/g.85169 Transcript_35163/m.85169 type:complete len:200 (-) Transcript_35163:1088-1687(-)
MCCCSLILYHNNWKLPTDLMRWLLQFTRFKGLSFWLESGYSVAGCFFLNLIFLDFIMLTRLPSPCFYSSSCETSSLLITFPRSSISSAFSLPEGKMMSYFGIVPEGHLLDIPNAFLGVLYYTYWLALRPMFPVPLTTAISTLAMMSSVFLAYKLLVLQELCLLCLSTHLINLRLVLRAYADYSKSKEPTIKEPPKIKRI